MRCIREFLVTGFLALGALQGAAADEMTFRLVPMDESYVGNWVTV